MKRIRILSPIALAAGALLMAGSATGYVLLNPPWAGTWNCTPNVTVDETGIASITDSDGGVSNVVGVINSMTDSWNEAGSARIINAHKGSTAAFAVGDGVPMITFSDPLDACTGTSCLATTFTAFVKRTGSTSSWRIVDADTVVNLAHEWTSQEEDPNGAGCSNEFYVEAVMVHEMGHALGLDHTSVAGATMVLGTTACSYSKATTETDDHNGIMALNGVAPCFNSLFQPCIAATEYLTGTGNADLQPYCGGNFTMGGNGTIRGWLKGPDIADFDLYLQKLIGGSFVNVDSGETTTSVEEIEYAAGPGTYRFQVLSYSGKGPYHLWYQRPTLFAPL